MDIRQRLKEGVLVFDGAMGTMLQDSGLKLGELPELLNITSPELIVEIHQKYLDAGSDIITTNTFGVNELKLKDSKYHTSDLIRAAVKNAKEAVQGRDKYIALDIGPIGELLEPMGSLSFEEAYEIYKDQILEGVKSGVDLILIETMTDLYEIKAAVLAAKENSDLPIFATMSYEEDKRTFTGCNIESMVMVLQGLGVDALGLNCSLGPKELEPLVDEILSIARIPVMVQPNAGLPVNVDGNTVFNVLPEEFSGYTSSFVSRGVRVIGGCCGTTNKHIEKLVESLKKVRPGKIENTNRSCVCTPTKTVFVNESKIIGERINPTGKKLFKKALVDGDIDYIVKEAINQVNAGAEILDVNVGLPEIDEEKTMIRVIKEIQSILDIPLQIDSTDPKVIEAGLRVYNGKAIVNSVNGEDKVLDNILPIVKKYGACVVGLTLDERGIPKSSDERFQIAEKIVNRALEYGIEREDIYIDCLTLTAAAQQEEVKATLKTLSLVKERLNVKTVLGVSNVSFGLPNRGLINKTFFAASLYAGLDLAIINPMNKEMMDTFNASKVLWNEDKGAEKYLKSYENASLNKSNETKDDESKGDRDLFKTIVTGIKEDAKDITSQLLDTMKPLEIINEFIVPALDLIGERYERGDIFLPQLIRSAETVKSSFEIIKRKIIEEASEDVSRGKILLATVKGDIHDIGKNIVKVLLESYNYEIIDLGKNVAVEKIREEVLNNDIRLIGLSALMTTTVKSMEEIIAELKKINPKLVIMVGGAVLNEDYAGMINADYYASDAKEAVNIAKKVLG